MSEITNVQGALPSYSANRRQMADAALKTKIEQKKDGEKKLALALAAVGTIAAAGIAIRNKAKIGQAVSGVYKKAKSKITGSTQLDNKILQETKESLQAKLSTDADKQADALLTAGKKVQSQANEILENATNKKSQASKLLDDAKNIISDKNAACEIKKINGVDYNIYTKDGLSVMTDLQAKNIHSIQQEIDGSKIRHNFDSSGNLTHIREGLQSKYDKSGKLLQKSAQSMYEYAGDASTVSNGVNAVFENGKIKPLEFSNKYQFEKPDSLVNAKYFEHNVLKDGKVVEDLVEFNDKGGLEKIKVYNPAATGKKTNKPKFTELKLKEDGNFDTIRTSNFKNKKTSDSKDYFRTAQEADGKWTFEPSKKTK